MRRARRARAARLSRLAADVIAAPVMFSSVIASPSSYAHDLAAREHEHTVAEPLQLDDVGREHDHGLAAVGRARAELVELDPRAGVDAAGRLVREQHAGSASSERAKSIFCWLPPESDETGVSTRRRPHAEALDLVGDDAALAAALHEAAPRDASRARAATCSRAPRAAATGPRHAGRPGGGRSRRAARRPGRRAERPAAERDRRRCAGSRPGERAQELALAVALDAGEADDLARPRPRGRRSWKRGPLRPSTRAEASTVDARWPSAGKTCSTARPMIRRRISASENRARGERAAGLAVAQDRDPVGDLLHLGQAVRDVDDRRAALGDRADALEQPLASRPASATRSARRARAPSTRARAPSRSRGAGGRRRSARRRARPGRSRRRPPRASRVSTPTRATTAGAEAPRHREHHVLGDRQVLENREVLVDDREPERLRRGGRRRVRAAGRRSRRVPESGAVEPAATAISVDLPAPFSPTSAWTSP